MLWPCWRGRCYTSVDLADAVAVRLGQLRDEPVLIAVIGLKIFFDVRAHIKEHVKKSGP